MPTKIADLAKQLEISAKDLKEKMKELGFDVSSKARTIDDETAELILEELKPSAPEGDVAELYDEIIAQERERELIKNQRRKTAGKDSSGSRNSRDNAAKGQTLAPILDSVEIGDSITVKEFSEKTGIKAAKIIGELMKNGILANINQVIDFDTAQIIADDAGVKLRRTRSVAGAEEILAGDISNLLKEDDPSALKERPPVVVVMGHVDHGKTKLLDAIRSADVVSGESGGITQHIGAYQVEKKGKLITFLDTPGHEAFTAMRARGAQVTDIAILVVAADEGVKPQTVEALNHAKEAKVPILVAINKVDKPDANLDRVKGELSEHGLQPEDWGGTTVTVPVSALKKTGIEDLLDMILLTADMENLKANPDREAVATIIEAHLDHNLGPVATVIVNTGTLHLMDNVIIGTTFGRIKVMKDQSGKSVREAGPSMPVLIAGLNETPRSGDILQAVKDERTARQRAEEVALMLKEKNEAKMSALNTVITQVKADKVLKIVIKADTKGSLEAIRQSIAKIKDEEVAVKIIHANVGTITESDILMASASRGIVVGFHSDYDSPHVGKVAEREHVEVKKYTIIYNLLDDIRKILSGMMEPEIEEVTIGRAEVKKIFLTKKKEMILGCRVTSGKMESKASLRIIRALPGKDESVVGAGKIESLRKVDDVVKEIGEGNECGIKFTGDLSVQEGDVLEAFREIQKQRFIS